MIRILVFSALFHDFAALEENAAVIDAYLCALEKKDPMPSFSQLPLRYPNKRSDIP